MGELLDFSDGDTIADVEMQSWDEQREVSADVIHDLLSGSKSSTTKLIAVRGARIKGVLHLDSTKCSAPLDLIQCHIPDGILAVGAKIPRLSLVGCDVAALIAPSIEVEQGIDLSRSTVHGPIDLSDARLGGNLAAIEASFDRTDAPFLASRIRVEGMVELRALEMQGTIHLLGSRVGSQLSLQNAWLYEPKNETLVLDGAQIGGDLFLDAGFTSYGQVRLNRASIAGKLYLDNSKLFFPENNAALFGDRVRIGLGVDFSEAYVQGAVSFEGAFIGGLLTMADSVVCCSYLALHLDGSKVTDLVNGHSSTFRGGIKSIQAEFAQGLTLSGAKVISSGLKSPALTLDGTIIGGSARLDSGFATLGSVLMNGCHIRGQLTLENSLVIPSVGYPVAVTLQNIRADADVIILDSLIPSVDLSDATVHSLVLAASADDLRATGYALSGLRYGNLYGIVAKHKYAALRWIDSGGGGQHDFAIGSYHQLADFYLRTGRDKDAKFIRFYAALRQAADGQPLSRLKTWVRFLRPTAWPRTVFGLTTGFGYYPLATLAWLAVLVFAVSLLVVSPNRDDFVPTKYSETSSVRGAASATNCRASYPCFSPTIYAADVIVPLVPFGQEEHWRVDASASSGSGRTVRRWLLVSAALGWLLTTFFVAGITGLLRRSGR